MRDRRNDERQQDADHDARRSTGDAEEDRLDQELQRMPISRVRSVTETSRIFMIPIPPTRSEIDATMASSADITWLELSCASATWLRLRTLKLSGWPF